MNQFPFYSGYFLFISTYYSFDGSNFGLKPLLYWCFITTWAPPQGVIFQFPGVWDKLLVVSVSTIDLSASLS